MGPGPWRIFTDDGYISTPSDDAVIVYQDTVIALDSRRGRCPMTTVDPDTLDVNRAVLKDIIARFDGKLALNAAVLRPGTIHVGDPVQLVWPTGRLATNE